MQYFKESEDTSLCEAIKPNLAYRDIRRLLYILDRKRSDRAESRMPARPAMRIAR